MPDVVLVVAGGDRPSPEVIGALPQIDVVVCADSGIEHALNEGWRVDLAVGDFDSVDPARRKQAEAHGARIQRHPANKDKTDLELALHAAVVMDPAKVIVIGIGGGRLDHAVGNLLVLTNPDFARVELGALVGQAAVTVVHRTCEIVGRVGETVSVFAVNGDAAGVTLEGMQYPLSNETLRSGFSTGVSNKLGAVTARVEVGDGVLLVIQPDRLAASQTPDSVGDANG